MKVIPKMKYALIDFLAMLGFYAVVLFIWDLIGLEVFFGLVFFGTHITINVVRFIYLYFTEEGFIQAKDHGYLVSTGPISRKFINLNRYSTIEYSEENGKNRIIGYNVARTKKKVLLRDIYHIELIDIFNYHFEKKRS